MNANPALEVVVLAAGRSSRMGFPKALARIDGELALARVLRIACARGLPARVVLGFHAAAIRARVPLEERDVVVNSDPDRGQTSSMRAGAAAVPPDRGIVLWPVDHAHVTEATFDALLSAFRVREPAIALVVPSHDGRRGHPLVGDATICREFARLRDDEAGHVVVRRDPRRVLHLAVGDAAVTGDFDTPEQLPTA